MADSAAIPKIEILPLMAEDGARSELRLVRAADTQDTPQNAPTLLFWPAMGVPARYYDPLLQALAAAGIHAAAGELRGLGSSNIRASRRSDFGFREMLDCDLPATTAALRRRFPHNPLFIGGHSLGGQLSTLQAARRPEGIAGLVLVASGAIHYPNFSTRWRYKALALAWLIPPVTAALGYFPGKRLGFAGTEARTVMNNWGRIVRGGQYRIHGLDFDFESAMPRLELPVLGISFDHDGLAPHHSMQALLNRLAAARVTHLQLSDADTDGAMNHFNWVKQPASVTPRITAWLRRMPPAQPPPSGPTQS